MGVYNILNDGIYAVNITSSIQKSATDFDTNHLSTLPVHINSSGCNYYEPNAEPPQIFRPDGRSDYQFIYIQAGRGTFFIRGVRQILEKGSLILYKPGERQHYFYDTTCNTRAYWVHFTGNDIEFLLRKNGLWDQSVYLIDTRTSFPEIVTKIIRELQFHAYNYELNCHAYFLELICSLSRSVNSRYSFSLEQELLIPALDMLNNNFQTDYDMKTLASLCGMSVSHFIRQFKKCTGFPPHQYRTMVRIANAKNKLLIDGYSISEVARQLGYDNPLYFSRIFKKYTGSTPSDYIKENKM